MLSKIKKLSLKVKIILIVAILFMLTAWIVALSSKNDFSYSQQGLNLKQAPKLTLENLAEKDTDGDGIPDWEEALWGTDPYKRETVIGIDDKDYIENRRKIVRENTGYDSENINLNETDIIAQDFLKTIISLKQSGNLNKDSINAVAQTLSKQVTKNLLPDTYTVKDIKTVASLNSNFKKYMGEVENTIIKYGNMENGPDKEIYILAIMLKEEDPKKEIEILKIGELYLKMAKEFTDIYVPEVLVKNHLSLVNSTAKVSMAIKNMSQALSNPIVGIAGLSQYYTYSGNLDTAFMELEAYIDNSGIEQ